MTGWQERRRVSALVVGTVAAGALMLGCAGPPAPVAATDTGTNRVGVTVFPASGRPLLPALSGPTLSGGALNLASLRGHVVVLNVWASWCVPCKAESPALVRVAGITAARGVVFVGIDENDRDGSARAFLAGIGSHYANLPDPSGQLLAQLRMLPPGIPDTLVVDRNGRVAARVIGATTQAQLTALLDQLLATS